MFLNSHRPLFFPRYNKRHVALKVAYIGWDYHGFAIQDTVDNTIEVRKAVGSFRFPFDIRECSETLGIHIH